MELTLAQMVQRIFIEKEFPTDEEIDAFKNRKKKIKAAEACRAEAH